MQKTFCLASVKSSPKNCREQKKKDKNDTFLQDNCLFCVNKGHVCATEGRREN